MRKSRPRYPRAQEVAAVRLALEKNVPMDVPLAMGWRESAKLVPNWRFLGSTGGVEWIVDVYRGGWCYVAVGSSTESARSIPAVLRFLRAHLSARGSI